MKTTHLSKNLAGCRVESSLRAGFQIKSQDLYNRTLFDRVREKGLFSPDTAGADFDTCLSSTTTARNCLLAISYLSEVPDSASLLEDARQETFVQCFINSGYSDTVCRAWASAFE
jgi:hypothetical protein